KLELEKVIEIEDYEEAARIRDRINKLENDNKE
ncbi:MAG: UvrB/UvrC motif-containing protein, partial [Spirochaetales bacterium]|nr:UvrB/UvrC motif-containing protein [Spirochaetales bacterium]